ncbi:terminase large subunit domain-containing protein [Fluviispira vulneris]|uniref:terminase large subunit domain-containing protein n=1 Tax=Fluviispira vulneris TaxID=2763012 RepID=UPI001647D52E|nr:terminase family protein [Fluviispira vulneris]
MSDKLTESLWLSGELSYKLHGNQKEIYNQMRSAKAGEEIVILAARRFGKSFLSAVYACELAIKFKNSKVILLAPSKDQAKEIYTPILKSISADAPRGFMRETKSVNKWVVGSSELVFAGFDTISEALRGRGAIAILVDEAGFTRADEYNYIIKSVLSPMLLPTFGGKPKGVLIFISTPAKLPDHPFNIKCEEHELQGKLKRYTVYDNPALTPEDITAIISECGGEDSPDFLREYMCRNVRDKGGLIIPKFDLENVINYSTRPSFDFVKWIVADTGGIRDKCVLHVFGRTVNDNKCVIIDERVLDENTDVMIIGKNILELSKEHEVNKNHIWVDAHGQTRVDLLSLCNISAPCPPKQDRDSAISALNAAFFRKDIFVLSNCEFTIKSLLNCTFNVSRTDFLRTAAYGHADAIMCAVYGWRVEQMVPKSKYFNEYGSGFQISGNSQRNDSQLKKIAAKLNPFAARKAS